MLRSVISKLGASRPGVKTLVTRLAHGAYSSAALGRELERDFCAERGNRRVVNYPHMCLIIADVLLID